MEETRPPLPALTQTSTAIGNVEPPQGAHKDEDLEYHLERADLVRIGLVAVAVAVSWFLPWQPLLRIDAVAFTATRRSENAG